MSKLKKSEHNGAKNGGGHYGKREEAKALSKKVRRQASKKEISHGLNDELMNQTCTFCKIISNKLSSSRVYEDKACIAFLDIHPINVGHVLIVPKKHVERISDLSSRAHHSLSSAIQTVVSKLQESSLKADGFNIFLSDGEVAGQEVPHIHYHIVPRMRGDKVETKFVAASNLDNSRKGLDEVANSIRGRNK